MMYNTKFISAVALLSGAQVNAVKVQSQAVALPQSPLELAGWDFEKALKIFDVVQATKLKPEQAKEALRIENWNTEHTIAIHLVTSATGLDADHAREMLTDLNWNVELPQQQQQVIQQPVAVVQERRRSDLRKRVPDAEIKQVADLTGLSENDAHYFLALNQGQVEEAIDYYLKLVQPAVDKFVQVTQVPVNDAVPFLKRYNFDVDKALHEYFKWTETTN